MLLEIYIIVCYIIVDAGMDNYLQNNPHKVEEYVIQNISQEQLERWLIRKTKLNKQKCRENSGA